ncbi:MAG: MFS transporter, partial [Gammaproteobacteria bacterium]|nr:MFS transporter [Gammaproteobacteria bacterium]
GIAMVGLYLVVESWLNTLIPDNYRGKIFSVYVAVTLFSLGVGQFLLLFYGAGSLATYALCAIFFILALVPISVTHLVQPTQVDVPRLILRRLINISPIGVAGALVTGLGNGAFWGLGALYAHNMGYSETEIALFMSAIIFGGALLQLPIGSLSDRFDRRKVLMAVCVFATLMALSIFIFSQQSQFALMLSAIFYGGFSFSVYSLSVAHTNDHIEPAEVMDATQGLLLLNGVGAAIGPILAGIFMQLIGHQGLMIYFSIVFGILALFIVFRMGISTPIPNEEQGDFVPMARTGTAAIEMDPRIEE